jgi:hypothetical protein
MVTTLGLSDKGFAKAFPIELHFEGDEITPQRAERSILKDLKIMLKDAEDLLELGSSYQTQWSESDIVESIEYYKAKIKELSSTITPQEDNHTHTMQLIQYNRRTQQVRVLTFDSVEHCERFYLLSKNNEYFIFAKINN